MVDGSRRKDPYRNFKFRVIFGAVVAGAAAVGLGAKLLLSGRKKLRKPPAEVDSGARPIEAVGTSTAGFVGATPAKRRRTARPKRSPRKRS